MLIYSRILVLHEKHGNRYIGGDMDKAVLMVVKERYEKGYYPEVVEEYNVKQILEDGDSDLARKILDARNDYGHEYYEIVTLEEAVYFKQYKDITARFWELVEYAKNNKIWDCSLGFKHLGLTEQDYKEALQDHYELRPPKDFVFFEYEIIDSEYDSAYDFTNFFKEWFGDVEIEIYHNYEVTISRKQV